MDEGQKREAEYVPSASQMQNVGLIILFIGYCFLAYVYPIRQDWNNWVAIGGWIWWGIFMLIKWGPLVIENRSPKGVCNRVGTTIATADPTTTIAATGVYPELGIWLARGVRWGVITSMTARAYIICPTALAYKIGQGKQGVNVFWNAHLQIFTDHRELPPHVYQALLDLGKSYKQMPAFFNVFPLMVNDPTPEQLDDYAAQFERLGVTREKFKDVRPILERYASTLSVFRYQPGLTKVGESLDQALRVANADNAKLRGLVETWSDYGDRMTKKFLRPELPPVPSMMERVSKMSNPATEEEELPRR